MGSLPGERTKIRGDVAVESANVFGRSNGGGSVNFTPKLFTIKFTAAGVIW